MLVIVQVKTVIGQILMSFRFRHPPPSYTGAPLFSRQFGTKMSRRIWHPRFFWHVEAISWHVEVISWYPGDFAWIFAFG
jgi:hypothetical protein